MTALTVKPTIDRHEVVMYAKLYSTILRSSIWLEDAETRLLWIAMLAAADEKGYVFGSPAGMAHTARISVEGTKKALAMLSSPDLDSSDLSENPENEGRRIEVVDGGWRIINYIRYRSIRDSDERREYNRRAKQKSRAKSAGVSQGQPSSANVSPSESEAESDTESEEEIHIAHFEQSFWSVYPRKVGKATALKAWLKLSDEDQVLADEGVRRLAESWKGRPPSEIHFCPHPTTWLNGRRWEDVPEPVPAAQGGNSHPSKEELLKFNKSVFGLSAQAYLQAFRQKFGCDPEGI